MVDDDDDDPTRVAAPRNVRANVVPPPPAPSAPAAQAKAAVPVGPVPGAAPLPAEEDDDQRRTAPAPQQAPVPAAPAGAPIVAATASSSMAAFTQVAPPPSPAPALPRRDASRPFMVAGSLAALAASALIIVGVIVIRGRRSPDAPPNGAPTMIESAAPPPDPSLESAAPPPDPSPPSASATTAPTQSATADESADAPAVSAPPADLRFSDVLVTLRSNVPARVYLDGSPIGTTPLGPIHVRSGKHKLKFRHTILGERVVAVNAKPGVPLVVSVDFQQNGNDVVAPAAKQRKPEGSPRSL
jgi:hypothetical protein